MDLLGILRGNFSLLIIKSEKHRFSQSFLEVKNITNWGIALRFWNFMSELYSLCLSPRIFFFYENGLLTPRLYTDNPRTSDESSDLFTFLSSCFLVFGLQGTFKAYCLSFKSVTTRGWPRYLAPQTSFALLHWIRELISI